MSATGFQWRRRELAAKQKDEIVPDVNDDGDKESDKGKEGDNIIAKINLTKLNKEKLLSFCKDKGLYEDSLDNLTKAQIIEALLERAGAKVVEAGLKTAEEITLITEDELFALFDSIGNQE